MKFSDQEIDQLLASVEDAMAQASKLAKSQPMYKDAEEEQMQDAAPEEQESEQPSEEESAADSAPEMDAGSEQDEGAPEAEQSEQGAEEGEQGEDHGDISDEELHEIYASMNEDELHRHLVAIEAALGGSQDEQNPEDMQAPESMAPPAQAPQMQPEQMAMKSEKVKNDLNKSEEFQKLKDENDQLKKSLDKVIAAMGKAFQPTRKAITNIEYIKKSESQSDELPLNKDETVAKLTQIAKSANLSKSDRQAINNYILTGGSEEQVKTILKGGK